MLTHHHSLCRPERDPDGPDHIRDYRVPQAEESFRPASAEQPVHPLQTGRADDGGGDVEVRPLQSHRPTRRRRVSQAPSRMASNFHTFSTKFHGIHENRICNTA